MIGGCEPMKIKSSLLVFSLVLLGACSNPTAYQVNPKPDEPTEQQEVPESQQEDYMRILGDLRWDKYISASDWVRDFPKCLKRERNPVHQDFGENSGKIREDVVRPIDDDKNCTPFTVGGINFYVVYVGLDKNSGTKTGFMTTNIDFRIPDNSQYRAFEAAIKKKYELNVDESEKTNVPLYCSKYTCWNGSTATPTAYTISLLDKVAVNSSEF